MFYHYRIASYLCDISPPASVVLTNELPACAAGVPAKATETTLQGFGCFLRKVPT